VSLAPYLAGFRRVAEDNMLDHGAAARPTGGYEYVDGEEVLATAALFESRYKIQTRGNLTSRETEVGGRTATETAVELHLPADSPPLQVGDLWTCTDPHPVSLEVEGRTWRVVSLAVGTVKTAARYEVEVLT
jgi:hypothetical protein